MKPFNLAEAKAGAPVVTRDGHAVKLLSFEATGQPIVGQLVGSNAIYTWALDGVYLKSRNQDICDLFMGEPATKKYVLLYPMHGHVITVLHDSRESAEAMIKLNHLNSASIYDILVPVNT